MSNSYIHLSVFISVYHHLQDEKTTDIFQSFLKCNVLTSVFKSSPLVSFKLLPTREYVKNEYPTSPEFKV
ncbi:unnamed protein product, partial [Heterobilharzia americana]